MRKTKIICTYGPAVATEAMLRSIILAGANVIRFNFSHGDHEYHEHGINLVKKLRVELGIPVAILVDTKGPEVRTGLQDQEFLPLVAGSEITITTVEQKNTPEVIYLNHARLCDDVPVGAAILIDDGRCKLEVLRRNDKTLSCRVVRGGQIRQRRGVNIPSVKLNMPFLSERDMADLQLAVRCETDLIAASFTRNAGDIKAMRSFLYKQGGFTCDIIAKIENSQGVENLKEICLVSDGLMVARGDLGVELPVENVPKIQKEIIKLGRANGKPVITATQMLESMIDSPRPTRAEVSDVANAIYDATSAIMLSGETAAGKYPVECVELMNTIALKTESDIRYKEQFTEYFSVSVESTKALANAALTTAYSLDVAAIVPLTSSGYSARLISRLRPRMDIISPTENLRTYYKMALYWGVRPMYVQSGGIDQLGPLFDFIIDRIEQENILNKGSLIILLGGSPVRISGSTNVLKLSSVGNVATRGKVVVQGHVSGAVHIYKSQEQVPEDRILVMRYLLDEDLSILHKARGLILQGGRGENLARIAGETLKIPVLASCEGACRVLHENEIVSLDGENGIVYRSK